MAEYQWPAADKRILIGKRISRVDGPQKVTGRAKYTYDMHPAGMLYGKIVRCPHAHARIKSIDTSAAEKHPAVKAVELMTEPGKEIFWAGDELVALAATDEVAAEDAARLVKIEYEVLPHLVSDAEPPADVPEGGPLAENEIRNMIFQMQVPAGQVVSRIQKDGITFTPQEESLNQMKQNGMADSVIDAIRKAKVVPPGKAGPYKRVAAQTQGDPDKGFAESDVVSEGIYGVPVITHCCLETHGAMSEWTDPEHLFVHISTQNVSGIPGQMSEPLKMPATNIRVHQDHIGGGFGSKFSVDTWGIVSAKLSKKAGGKPVKIMLERQAELEVAGARPSAYARVKVGAKKDGTLTAWEHSGWGTGGIGGGGAPPLPYVVNVPNQKKQHTAISNHIGSARAWRAPNHPQACLITMAALEDLAAKLKMDPMDFFLKNIELTGPRAKIYTEEIQKAAEMIGWKKNWHPRPDSGSGPVKRGLGMSMHTWGGRGHNSENDFSIHPDGSVLVRLGSQDLGTGTRTCIQIVAADSLGIPFEAVKVELGDTQYPPSGGSGGSTTIGGVSASTRRGAIDALNSALRESRAGVERETRGAGVGQRDDSRGGGSEEKPLLEAGLREVGRDARDRPRRQQERHDTGPDQQRRGRRPDGGRFRGHRDGDREGQQDRRGAGLRPDHRPEDRGEPGLRRPHHGHRLQPLRRKDHGRGDRPDAQPEHGVLPADGHRRLRRARRAHDDGAGLRRAGRHRAGRAAGGLAGGGHFQRRGQRDRRPRSLPAADAGPRPRGPRTEGGAPCGPLSTRAPRPRRRPSGFSARASTRPRSSRAGATCSR